MIARLPPSHDPRVALITRIIGDHRTAPNLWLVRRIVQALTEFDERANVD